MAVEDGSSARTEIDPWVSACRILSSRFLRLRGDRPDAFAVKLWTKQGPPSARRWTRRRQFSETLWSGPPLARRLTFRDPLGNSVGAGSSAYAEMARPLARSSLGTEQDFGSASSRCD